MLPLLKIIGGVKLEVTNGQCPGCGHKFFYYSKQEYRYGSPIRTCKKCGCKYVDTRYHEIAVEEVRDKKQSVIPAFILMLIGAFVVYRGFCLWGGYHYHSLFPAELKSILFFIIGALVIIAGIVMIIAKLTGSQKRRMDKLLKESEERLKDKNYAQTLARIGYNVPDKYLYESVDVHNSI